MKPICPNCFPLNASPVLSSLPLTNPNSGSVVRNGRFFRRSDSRWIDRFLCRDCGRHFSRATASACFGQKKRRINHRLKLLLCSGVSQRRSARILGVNEKTVARRLKFLAQEARRSQNEFLRRYQEQKIACVQFDDLETSEHSKCKPLSVALAVEPKSRRILSFQVSQMPAKGLLAATARRKYGPRNDERGSGWHDLMKELIPFVREDVVLISDENPHYPRFILKHHPKSVHAPVKGRRGCIAGQGELKKIGFDPLFSLNHTCAMLRANLNRLFRKTWCTTKKREGLRDHLALYVDYHNQVLTSSSPA